MKTGGPALRLYDSHCHLHDRDVAPEAAEQLARAAEQGVERLLLAGVDEPGWRDAIALAADQRQLRLAFGVHPQVVGVDPAAADAMTDRLAEDLITARLPRPAALGETGLDGSEAHAPALEAQERVFRRHVALAARQRLPLVLHVLRAHPRALAILEAERLPPRPGVLHSCSASAELCARYLALGFHVSFSGAITHPGARRLHAAARAIPLERLLVETDAPFQTPVSRRPGRNEPAFLVEILAALAQIRGEPLALIAQATFANACRLFDEE